MSLTRQEASHSAAGSAFARDALDIAPMAERLALLGIRHFGSLLMRGR